MAHPTRFERVASTFGGQRSIYAARRGMALSTNRKNRVLRAPATNDSCEIPIPGTDVPFRRDRVLRVQDLNLRPNGKGRHETGWRKCRRKIVLMDEKSDASPDMIKEEFGRNRVQSGEP
jgi:hypothetical protein